MLTVKWMNLDNVQYSWQWACYLWHMKVVVWPGLHLLPFHVTVVLSCHNKVEWKPSCMNAVSIEPCQHVKATLFSHKNYSLYDYTMSHFIQVPPVVKDVRMIILGFIGCHANRFMIAYVIIFLAFLPPMQQSFFTVMVNISDWTLIVSLSWRS